MFEQHRVALQNKPDKQEREEIAALRKEVRIQSIDRLEFGALTPEFLFDSLGLLPNVH